MKWLKALTYGASALCGIAAFVFPVASAPLLIVSGALAGWATRFPGDGKLTPEAAAELARIAAEQTQKLRR